MKHRFARWLHLTAMMAILLPAITLFAPAVFDPLAPPAMADDDDDDDSDDNGGSAGASGGERSGGGETQGNRVNRSGTPLIDLFRQRPDRTAARSAEPALPLQAPDEIIATGLDASALATLTTEGYAIAERQVLSVLDGEVVRLILPSGTGLNEAQARIGEIAPTAETDVNHFYRPEQTAEDGGCADGTCPLVRNLIGWPEAPLLTEDRCGPLPRIGMIDTAINPDHDALRSARLTVIGIGDGSLPASSRQHGTAVAALLVGAKDSRAPGLLPGSELIAVDAFRRVSKRADLASAFDLVKALDILASREVRVINLSLSGPTNRLVERTIARLVDNRTIIVAAVGNHGPKAPPLYPAAYAGVIAVTAIDRRFGVFRRANQGPHVDIAAPGVNVWTAASVAGARPKTGTSFAAPFVSAAAALLLARDPGLGPQEVKTALSAMTRDIGLPGKDPVFGWGVLEAQGLCADHAIGRE